MVIFRYLAFLGLLLISAPDLSGQDGGTVHVRFRHDLGSIDGRMTVKRWDYLLSKMAFRYANSEDWVESEDWFGFVSATEKDGRAFELTGVPLGKIEAVRFQIGLEPAVNERDPNTWPPFHALNPQVNGLQWEWQGGYIFMALEGLAGTEKDGFSYHLARNGNAVKVELPVVFDLIRGATIDISVDVSEVLGKGGILPDRDGSSTHSRENDPILPKLKERIANAFAVKSVSLDIYQAPQEGGDEISRVLSDNGLAPVTRRFPQVNFPADNPLTKEGIQLGRALFHEPLLSRGETQSCSTCHLADRAFSDGNRFSKGVAGLEGKRNSMALFNLAWHEAFFWDGRVKTIREQALHPIIDPLEMGETLENVVEKLKQDQGYPARFEDAFGSSEINPERIGLAIEQFLLTLISQDSKFDRAARGEVELTEEERRGLELFVTEHDPGQGKFGADCFHCHGGNLFVSKPFANNGLDEVFTSDPGLFNVTKNSGDEGKFKVPSLRNIEVTGPYMHDGRFETLEEVVEHYNSGVQRSATLDPNLAKHPVGGLGLSEEDKAALVLFLKTLTDNKFLSVDGKTTKNDQDCSAFVFELKTALAN